MNNQYPIGTISFDLVKKAIYNWVSKQVKGLKDPEVAVIWRNQSEPLPQRPCVAMKIVSGPTRTGYGDNLMAIPNDDLNRFVIGGQRTMIVSVQIFGSTKVHRPLALQLALDLNSSLSKLTVLEDLRAGGLAVQRQGDPVNITELEESEYEERAQFDVLFGLAQNVLDDPGIITEVHGDGGVHDDNHGNPINVEIDVTV